MKHFKAALFALALLSNSALAQNMGIPVATTVTVTYPDSSSRFNPPEEVVIALKEANNAAVIYVYGRTSTDSPSPRDEALAFKRAAAARAYLINKGISPLKIMVNYASAADYAVDNSSDWGRAANQRVEIEMVFIDRSLAQ